MYSQFCISQVRDAVTRFGLQYVIKNTTEKYEVNCKLCGDVISCDLDMWSCDSVAWSHCYQQFLTDTECVPCITAVTADLQE